MQIERLMVFQVEDTLGTEMFYPGSLFMEKNAYVAECKNEGGRGATPTSISKFDSYDMKTM